MPGITLVILPHRLDTWVYLLPENDSMEKKATKTNKIGEKWPNLKEDSKDFGRWKADEMGGWMDGWMMNGWADDGWMYLFNRHLFVEYVPGNFQELEIQITF